MLVLLLGATSAGTVSEAKPVFESGPVSQVEKTKGYAKMTFQIQSITCPACAYGMEREMAKLPGVKYVKIELIQPNGALSEVVYDSSTVQQSAITDIVHEFHYTEAVVQQVPFTGEETIKHDTTQAAN